MTPKVLLDACLLLGLLPGAPLAAEPEVVELRRPSEVAVQKSPLEGLQAFLASKRVLDPSELEQAPYLLGNRKGAALSATGDLVYARGVWPAQVERFEIVRAGMTWRDPRSDALLGMEVEVLGEASLLQVEGERASLYVESSKRELRAGDRLLPKGEHAFASVAAGMSGQESASAAVGASGHESTSALAPRSAPEPGATSRPVAAPGLQGHILVIRNGLRYGGSLDSLLLDLGHAQGLVPGQQLLLRRPEREVADVLRGESLRFPGETVGTVLVYRVFASTSLALILDSNGPIRRSDLVVAP